MPLDEAIAVLLARAQPTLPAESVVTFEADGRVLAQDLVSGLTVPPRDNSAMDGYAVRVADCPTPGTELVVAQRIPAGTVGTPLAAGTAARIFTGAQIPEGADAVVMIKSLLSAASRSAAMVASRSSGTMPRSFTSQPRRCSKARMKKRLEL